MHQNFIEAAVFLQPPSVHSVPRWKDESTANRLYFTAPFGYVSLTKRHSYPETFAYVRGDVLWCGYGPLGLAEKVLNSSLKDVPEAVFCDDEFLYIAIDCRQRTITVQTDGYNTISIFVGSQADRCVVSNDFARAFALLDRNQCRLNIQCVAQYLLDQQTHDRTFVQNIQLLYDRKRLQWSPAGEKLWLPPDASMKDFHHNRTGDARQFPQFLEQTLNAYWTRYVGNAVGGCELSCGLDSSVVTGYLADQGYRPVAITGLFPKNFGLSQRQKLYDFSQRFDIESIALPANEHLDYPWIEVLQGQRSQPFYHYKAEPYHTSHHDLYAALAQAGVTTVLSGIGGDELFEHVDHRRVLDNTNVASSLMATLPVFRKLAAYAANLEEKQNNGRQLPIPLKSYSSLTYSHASGNSHLVHGLWFASPLADARLYAYMQTLPLHYCIDKLLLRIYADARRLPKTITLPVVNEDYRHVLVESFHKLKEVILYMLDHSMLIKNGLLERRLLDDLYQKLVSDNESGDFTTALIFKRILHAELNLRSLGLTL